MIWIKGIIRLLFLCLILGILGFFISYNTQAITVSLFPLPFEIDAPVYAVALFALFIGLLAGSFSVYMKGLIVHWKTHREHKQYTTRIRAMEQEIAALRMENKNYRQQHEPPSRLVSLP